MVADEISQALEALRPELLRYLVRMVLRPAVAEELVQQTAVRALEALDRAPTVAAELRPWLFRIATRLAIDARRRHSFQREDLMGDLRREAEARPGFTQEAATFAGTPETRAVAREHLTYCFRCTLQNLSGDQAASLLLKEMHHLSNGEIAQQLDLEPAQVKNRLQEARRLMRDRYQQTCALVNKQGVCHQCVELSGFFRAEERDPLAGTAGDLDARLGVVRGCDTSGPGPWTRMLDTLTEAL